MAKFAAERAAAESGTEVNGDATANAPMPSDDDVETVYLAVYKNFMEAVDAIDNGVDQYENAGEPRYISQTNLSARVGGLNPFVSVLFFSGFFSGFIAERGGSCACRFRLPFFFPAVPSLSFSLSLFLTLSLPIPQRSD